MTVSTVRNSGLNTTLCWLFWLTITAGCATTEQIDPNQETIEPTSSVVAFSVDTNRLTKNGWWTQPVWIHLRYGTESISIRLREGKSGVQRILLEVPVPSISFARFEVSAGTGIRWNHYQTGDSQQFSLNRGEITYLGRIEIEDARFEESIYESRVQPTAIKLVFSDASENDLLAWRQKYKIFQGRVPHPEIIGNWGGQDYLWLWKVDSSRTYAEQIQERNLDSAVPDIMGPTPSQDPH